jgi:hypothetical protein
MKDLEAKLTMVELQTGAELTVNGTKVPPEKWSKPLPMPPGKATIELKLSNGQAATSELELKAGEPQQVALEMPKPEPEKVIVETPSEPPPPPPQRAAVPYRTLAWTGAGMAGAGLVGFTVFGLMASSRSQQLEDECTGTQCPRSLRDVAEDGRTYQTWANVSLGVGLVGLVGGAIFFLSDKPASAEQPAPTAKTSKRGDTSAEASTALVIGPGNVAVWGQF